MSNPNNKTEFPNAEDARKDMQHPTRVTQQHDDNRLDLQELYEEIIFDKHNCIQGG